MSRRGTTPETRTHPPNHRGKLSRIKAITRQLTRLVSAHLEGRDGIAPAQEIDTLVISLMALACLRRRGLCPRWLADTPAINLLLALPSGPTLLTDGSRFGESLTRVLAPAAQLPDSARFVTTVAQLLSSSEALELADDPLLAGWVDQCLGEKVRRLLAGIAPDADAQSARSRDIEPSLLPSLTQWYTPEWIGKFLVEESVDKHYLERSEPGPAVFDPACGAGHLLVPALNRMVAARCTRSSAAVDEVVDAILQDQLFGCDIDRHVVDLTALSLYLASRELVPTGELPLPNLFHFDIDSEGSAIGSLWLGLEQIPSDVSVWNLDNQMPLHASPLNRQFDVVLTNPPYLSHRLMPPEVSSFLKHNYQAGHFDLYAGFLQLAMRLLSPGGRMAMICQQSFMSIQRYAALREELTERCDVQCLVQLGPGVFAARAGEKVNNAIIVARRRSDTSSGRGASHAPGSVLPEESRGDEIRCWRVLQPAQKMLAEEHGIASLPETGVPHSQFAIISGAPFSFWCPPAIARLFQAHPPMESQETGITLTNGLFTCNNAKFVKSHWQVQTEELSEYVPYDKGGGHKWYRTTPYMLHWGADGEAIREYRAKRGQSRRLPGERFYFRTGITYSYIGTKGFRARLLSPDSIFDIASSAVFSDRLDALYLLGFLNSSLARFLLGVLNPTINFQIGDLRRLPLAMPTQGVAEAVIEQASTAVELARDLDALDTSSPRFSRPVLLCFDRDGNIESAFRCYVEFVEGLNQSETACQRLIDDLIYDLYQIPASKRALIESDPWVARERKPLCKPMSLRQCVEQLESTS